MPRPRWPHLLREVSRHGTVRWVVRIGHGPRIALEGEYGTKEFEASYHRAVDAGSEGNASRRSRRSEGSLSWLIARYQGSSEWAAFSKATRKKRSQLYRQTLVTAAEMPYAEVTSKHIREGVENRKATPSQANNWLEAMRRLFAWAVEQEFLTVNPAEGVKNARRPKTGGFEAWTETDVDAFKRRWRVGSRERLAFSILLHTGLRRGDCAVLGLQHTRNGRIEIKTEKTGTQLTIPILPELREVLGRTKREGFTFICGENGKPLTKESFGNWFSKACRAAGVNKSAHGLRKLAATRLANAGVSEAELDATMGWTPGSRMSRVYIRNRDIERLSRQAAEKLRRAE